MHAEAPGGYPLTQLGTQSGARVDFSRFSMILESFFGALGGALALSLHPASHQIGQRRLKNGATLSSMQKTWHKLAFRTASGGPRTPF